jgi:5-methyltetrahydropteroyltriglutamate--homocysteine methyltransferase
MDTLVDDVGSFPLTPSTNREAFSRAYEAARQAIINGEDPSKDEFTQKNYCTVILDSFRRKLQTGLDVANFPQNQDAIRKVGEVIHKAMEKGSFVVDEKEAILPEVHVINSHAKRLSEEFGKKIALRVSLFGPMEQYLKEIGTTAYADVLESFAETIRRFCKTSLLDNKYIKTEVVSIDEPSFGFLNINADSSLLCEVMTKAFDFIGATRQIHLHSSARLPDLLGVKNIDVLSFEYAASPKNIEGISKRLLETSDKFIRVGVARTDIDAILAELHDQGVAKPSAEQLVETQETIRKRFIFAKEKYGDRMTFTGPDCGLGGWPSQESAQLLLERTVTAVKSP